MNSSSTQVPYHKKSIQQIKGNTYNIGTTKPLEIALPADQQARRKYITNTEHRDLRKRKKNILYQNGQTSFNIIQILYFWQKSGVMRPSLSLHIYSFNISNFMIVRRHFGTSSRRDT